MIEIKDIDKAHIAEYGKIYARAFSREPWNDPWRVEDAAIKENEVILMGLEL